MLPAGGEQKREAEKNWQAVICDLPGLIWVAGEGQRGRSCAMVGDT
jgi:hypothetical protein